MVSDNTRQFTARAFRLSFLPVLVLAIVGTAAWWSPSSGLAMHAADHRFNVEGYVCGPDGKPVAGVLITAKDTRVDVRATTVTDSQGYFKAVLHLHNDNRGDPIVVIANDQEKKTTAEFDPNDTEADRGATFVFGSGCDKSGGGTPTWVYYTAGIGLAMAGAVAGARLIKAARKPPQKRRGKRK
jgi:hypothetical protein